MVAAQYERQTGALRRRQSRANVVLAEEAAELRDLIEFGYLAAWMAGEAVASLDRIADSLARVPELLSVRGTRGASVAGDPAIQQPPG